MGESCGEARKPEFNDMPNEIIQLIIQNLFLVEKLRLRLTSSRMANLVTNEVRLQPELSDDSADTFANMDPSYHFTSLKTTNLMKPHFLSARTPSLRSRSQVTKLNIQENRLTGHTISSLNFLRLFHTFPNVTELVLYGKVLCGGIDISPQLIRKVKLDNLLLLKFVFAGAGCLVKFDSLGAIARAKFPRLKTLDVLVTNGHNKLFWNSYHAISLLISRHITTLKNLKIDDQSTEDSGWTCTTPRRVPSIAKLLNQLQLETLELTYRWRSNNSWPPIKWIYAGGVDGFIANQRSLRVLIINCNTRLYTARNLQMEILTAIKQSSNTLDSLTYKNHPAYHPYDIDMRNFCCPNLTRLTLRTNKSVVNLEKIPNSIQYLYWDTDTTMNEFVQLRRCLPRLIEIEFGHLAGTPPDEIINGFFENPNTKRIICPFDARILAHLAQNQIQSSPTFPIIFGFPVVLRRELYPKN